MNEITPSIFDQISDSILKQCVPLGLLSQEQQQFLLESCELLNLFAGQPLCKMGDTERVHYYLLHGNLKQEDASSHFRDIYSSSDEAKSPIAYGLPRRVNISASTDAQVLKVPIDTLEQVLCWGQVAKCLLAEVAKDAEYKEDYLWIKKLLSSRLFYKVPPMNIVGILKRFQAIEVKAGDQLIQEGDEGSCCYLLKTGSADVVVKAQGDTPVASLSAGAVFGEDALVNNKPRNASVIMQEDGVLMKLEKQDFFELLKPAQLTSVMPTNITAFLKEGAKLLDVRTQAEFDGGHFKDAMNLPLHLIYLKSALLDKQVQYITYSASEERAKAAAFLLNQQGFNAFYMQGGVENLNLHLSEKFNEKA